MEIADAPAGHEYRVFFTVRRDRATVDTVLLIVQSAYFVRMDWGQRDVRRKPVRFRIILVNAVLEKALREPL